MSSAAVVIGTLRVNELNYIGLHFFMYKKKKKEKKKNKVVASCMSVWYLLKNKEAFDLQGKQLPFSYFFHL